MARRRYQEAVAIGVTRLLQLLAPEIPMALDTRAGVDLSSFFLQLLHTVPTFIIW
jgi:hypothetical protein